MKIITLEDLIQDLGEIPYCKCNCGNRVRVKPNKYGSYVYYLNHGYPSYLLGHQVRVNNPMNRLDVRERQLKSCRTPKFREHCKIINLGKIASLETREKQRIAKIGKYDGENNPMYGVSLTGEDHWNWQGGITPLNEQIRYSQEYFEWRIQVFIRDNFTCQDCDICGGWLEAHHIKRFSDIIKDNNITSLEQALSSIELWNINNGITLCKKCHDKIPSKIKKLNGK